MRSRTVVLDARDWQPWHIYCLSDAHIGDRHCAERDLRAYIARIAADPKGRLVITGDLISAIGKGDKRLDLRTLADWVLDKRPGATEDVLGIQAAKAVEWLTPVADKIDGVISGNHEQKPRAWYGRDIMAEICQGLGIPQCYLGSLGWLVYSVRITKTCSRALDMLLHHGVSADRKAGGQLNQLEEILCDYDCDIAVCGHSHETLIKPWPQVMPDRKTGKLQERRRWGVMAGTWQQTPADGDGWQDERRLRPKRIGGVVIEYDPRSGAVEVSA